VNKFWLRASDLAGFASEFINLNPLRESAPSGASDEDWRALRNRWEYSHVLRAALACISFDCLAVGVAI
jgi:hypothetical protein